MSLEREWVSIRDPQDAHLRYTFDVSFLLSNYHCIYGQGCPGIRSSGPDHEVGCCEHGAYYVDEAERKRIEKSVEHLLDDGIMQFHGLAREEGVTTYDGEGEAHTRQHDGACIFLNRAGWPAGMGCAFHVLAERRGEHHMTYKPTVCWQLPLHRSISEEVGNDGETLEVHTIAGFERGTWGEGGADFHWWCLEDPAAFTAADPVYRGMEQELREMVGDEVYTELRDYLDARADQPGHVRFLPMA